MTEEYNNSVQDDEYNRNSNFEIKEKFIATEKDIETFEIVKARISQLLLSLQNKQLNNGGKRFFILI